MTHVPFDPEFAGGAAGQPVQALILSRLAEIAAAPGLVSRGSRIAVLDARTRPLETLPGIATRFGSAVFFLEPSAVDRCRRHLGAAGLATGAFLIYASTGPAFDRSAAIAADDLPGRLGL